jgi:hypothetical protein
MSLADDIRSLRDRVLADLNAAHDYHHDTAFAWCFVQDHIASGTLFTFQNTITGTVTTQADLAHKLLEYVSGQLTEATFQQFISIFESFFFHFLRLWLASYPRSLSGKKVDFKAILDAPDKDAIIQLAVGKELNEVLYERPTAWFAYLEDKVKLGCPTADEIDRIAEAKASRDVLVHNRGVVGKIYEAKAGRFARYKDGDKIDVSEPYHRETWELLRKVVADVSNAALAKAPLAASP